ncbi:hypothetical protein PVAND_010264 [Polypedilum vanderplanki]|uniref:Uncharacterized protein n=1 Tax=Polypedilum vanderplanki TaxID=319348 RepID=A0A9J6CF16_POLVA|nr:hypothetical protein PVAND_010264 [Polypedilum vanderplanki]
MGVVSLHPTETLFFPSAGICEMGYTKEEYKELEKLIYEMMDPMLTQDEKEDKYSYDIEDFLLRVVFHNLYNFGSMTTYCMQYINCTNGCLECPMKNYQKYADRVRASCKKLFTHCEWNGVEIDCCKYFKPVRTTLGTCYIVNSLQVIDKDSKDWLDMTVGMRQGNGNLNLTVTKSSSLYILNEEDIPHILLTTLNFPQIPEGYDGELLLSVQDVTNDPYLRNIDPAQRKCVFPDEPSKSAYRKYSYSTCVTECLKKAQIKICNCTHYNLIVDDNDKSPECDFYGLGCLDKNELLFPQTIIMQPWRADGLDCTCMPSCNEKQINVIGRSSKIRDSTSDRSVSIRLQTLSTQKYFRQAVREKIDVVGNIIDKKTSL